MAIKYIFDKQFKNTDFTKHAPELAEYVNCVFLNCNFTNLNLKEFSFEDCTFENCELSNIKVYNTLFKNIKFHGCKLLGIQFDACNTFLLAFEFENSSLDFSSFYQLKIDGTKFINCSLSEVDFSETALNGSHFINCDLTGAMFNLTQLEKADLRSARNFSIDPENNRIQKAMFSSQNLSGLLHKYDLEID